MSLIELAEQCEKACGADREIDLRIQMATNPEWAPIKENEVNFHVRYGGHPRFSASLDAAMSLVPESAGLGIERYWNQHGEVWSAEIRTGGVPDNPRKVFDCYDAATPALALCAAALRARAQQEQTI